jgi:hypothetical protein
VVFENISLIYIHSKCASTGNPCSFMIKASIFVLKD